MGRYRFSIVFERGLGAYVSYTWKQLAIRVLCFVLIFDFEKESSGCNILKKWFPGCD